MAVNVNNGTSLGSVVVIPLKGEKGEGVAKVESQIDLLNQRIDQFIAPSGEAPNPTEITDARIGSNGITYTTLGQAIRDQVSDLKGNIIALSDNNLALETGTFEDGNGTAKVRNVKRIRVVSPIKVEDFVRIKATTGYAMWVFMLDKNMNLLGTLENWVSEVSMNRFSSRVAYLNFAMKYSSNDNLDIHDRVSEVEKGMVVERVLNTSVYKADVYGTQNNPVLERGDIYVSSAGEVTYYDSNTRVRTKQGTSVALTGGTKVGLSDYNGYRFILYLNKGNGTYSNPFGGWKQEDVTINVNGDYLIMISSVPEATISSLDSVANLLVIQKSESIYKMRDDISVFNNRKASVDYIDYTDFELGDLYVNASGVGTYYSSTTRLRTIRNKPLHLNKGDVIGLIDSSLATFFAYKKNSDGTYTGTATAWNNSSQLIVEDGLYEVLMRYPTEAKINNAEQLISNFVIKRKYGIVREESNVENLTDVYRNELETTIASVRAKTTSRGLVFGIITDTHLDNKRVGFYNQTMENLERLSNGIQFNGIFHLGDIINGYDTADVAKYHLQYAVERLLKIGKQNTYITTGNHDNNNGAGEAQTLTDYELYSYLQRFNEHYVNRTMDATDSTHDSPSSNYYVDYPTFKLRMIMFDSVYYGQGFSEDMMSWMSDLLASTPSDYNFVLFTHESTEQALNGGVPLGNATAFKNLLAQYKDRIYCYIHGHSHYDYVGYDNEFAQIALCSGVPDQPSSNVPEGGIQPSRTIGTVTQDCISIIILLPKEQKVELVRFGAGSDRSIPFRAS